MRTPRLRFLARPVSAAVVTGFVAGCAGPFDRSDFLAFDSPPERTRDIDAVEFRNQATGDLVSVDEASQRLIEIMADPLAPVTPPEILSVSQEELRAAALANNLDLEVQLIEPTIAQTTVDAEEAKFEAVLTGSASTSRMRASS